MVSTAKESAQKALCEIRQGFMTALAGAACLRSSGDLDCLTAAGRSRDFVIVNRDGKGIGFPLDSIRRALLEDRPRILRGFLKVSIRSAVRESYEVLKSYCKNTDQYRDAMKAQAWFDFYRLLRDALSHDAIWRFDPRDKRKLPITWNGFTITSDLDGTPLTFEELDLEVIFSLLRDAERFLAEDLQ